MTSSSFLFLVILVLPQVVLAHDVIENKFLTDERRLYKDLLDHYEKAVRPVRLQSDTLTVNIGLSLLSIGYLDEESQVLKTFNWLKTRWVDFQMTWNPIDYGGIKYIHMPIKELWSPDLEVYNSASPDMSLPMNHMAIVYNDGSILWVPPISFETQCLIDLTYFPFDLQTCHIKIGSWTYNGDHVNLTFFNGDEYVETAAYQPSIQWDLISITSKRNLVVYPCCPEPYVDVTFTLELRRHAVYSLHLFVAPSVTLSLIIPVVFAMPAGSTEKISLGVGVLISHVLLLGELIRFVPSGHHHSVPLMAHFFVANIVVVALSLVISMLIVNCWSRGVSRRTGPPAILKLVFLNQIFTKMMCFDFSQYSFVNEAGIDNPVLSIGSSMEAVNSDQTAISDDKMRMMQDKERLLAVSEWRQLANVIDRLFFILYVLVVIVMCLGFTKFL